MNVNMTDKSEIRKAMLDRRLRLDREEILSFSAMIEGRIISSSSFSASRAIMAYMPIRNEVMTDLIIKAAHDAGKILCLPRVTSLHNMEAATVDDLEADLEISPMGIREPRSGIPPLDPSCIEIIIVPGIAFDRSGYRIGFGKGYYDRFIPLLRPDCLKISPAYHFQVLESVPHDEKDIPVDMIVTEKGTITACR